MILPFAKKFRVDLYRNEDRDGWCFRILAGIVFLAVHRNYTHHWDYWDKQSGISVGYIPLHCNEGDRMPAWNWLWVTQARIGGGL